MAWWQVRRRSNLFTLASTRHGLYTLCGRGDLPEIVFLFGGLR